MSESGVLHILCDVGDQDGQRVLLLKQDLLGLDLYIVLVALLIMGQESLGSEVWIFMATSDH